MLRSTICSDNAVESFFAHQLTVVSHNSTLYSPPPTVIQCRSPVRLPGTTIAFRYRKKLYKFNVLECIDIDGKAQDAVCVQVTPDLTVAAYASIDHKQWLWVLISSC